MGAMPGSNSWQEYKHGFGPDPAGLFGQGNFGIVTKMGFRLLLLMFAGGTIPAAVLSGSQVYARDANQISSIQGLIVQVAQLGPFFGPPLIAAVVAGTGNWEAARWVLLAAATLGTLFGQLAHRTERALTRPAPC